MAVASMPRIFAISSCFMCACTRYWRRRHANVSSVIMLFSSQHDELTPVAFREEGFPGLLCISGETGRNELLPLFFIEHGEQDCDHFTHLIESHLAVFNFRVYRIPFTCASHGKARCAGLGDSSLVGRK